jgi:hypothetical protein
MPKEEIRNAEKKRKVAQTASRAAPENWLAWLDEQVRTVGPPTHWSNADAFVLVRYPHLRPKRPCAPEGTSLKGVPLPKLEVAQEAYDEECRDFWRDVASWESKITAWKRARRVLKGLTSEERQQLAALLSDSELSLHEYPKRKQLKRMLQSLVKAGPAQARKLKRKLHKFTQAAEDYRNYSTEIHPWLRPGSAQPAGRILAAARGGLKNAAPEAARNDSLDGLNKLAKAPSFRKEVDLLAENPLEREMVMLYWFFKRECMLLAGESEVRVAMIRNSFWAKFGIEKVVYRSKYSGFESAGCDAVRRAVLRFHLA